MSILETVVGAVVKEIIDEATPVVTDFLTKTAPKNAAIDQANGMYDISHVAVLGGEHD